MALLQQCAWKFPHVRAEQNLDYRPTVSFAEGIERSFAWWRFAQGQVSFAA
jgi:nucleoside-diphosphate-sugar epimerase